MERNDRSNGDEQSGTGGSVPAEASAGSSNGEWERVERTSAFGELMRRKKAFLVPAEIFSFVFFMAWPVLGGLTTVLDGRAVGSMTWASVYGFAQFAMILVILHLYLGRAKKCDGLVDEARVEASRGRTSA